MAENMTNYEYRRYKIKIYPTEKQKVWIKEQADVYRAVYNWALTTQLVLDYEGYPLLSEYSLAHEFSIYRNEHDWAKAIPLHTGRAAIHNVMNAIKQHKNNPRWYGPPAFKQKRGHTHSFQFSNDACSLYFKDNLLKLPGLPRGEYVECKSHNVPEAAIYYGPTLIFNDFGEYWISLSIRYETIQNLGIELSDESIGIDLGLRKTAQLSNGKVYNLPDTKKLVKRRNRLMRKVKRDEAFLRNKIKEYEASTNQAIAKPEPSKNSYKRMFKFYKTNKRIVDINHSYIHNMTTEIANIYPKRVVMEHLNQQRLSKWRHYNKQHDGVALHEIRKKMEYKCKDRGIEFVLASKGYPSSQICSRCGNRHNPGPSETYICGVCGLVIDRDLNAAINLSRYYDGLSWPKA